MKHHGISQVLRKVWRLECLRLKDKLSIGEQHVRGRSYKAHSGVHESISFTHLEEQEEPKKLQIFLLKMQFSVSETETTLVRGYLYSIKDPVRS